MADIIMAGPALDFQDGLGMYQKGFKQPFFGLHAPAPRPLSEATEIYDTEFEDDFSDTEMTSSRRSMESFDKKSDTTVSSFDEVTTPKSNHFNSYGFPAVESKPVEGPKGPHLFRFSQTAPKEYLDMSMSLSPIVNLQEASQKPEPTRSPQSAVSPRFSSLPRAVAQLEPVEVRRWTPQQVASWMYGLGFEESVVDKFERNDISGAILVDLQFEDLKELDIQSFGKRHRLWNEIHHLRGNAGPAPNVVAATDIERPATSSSSRGSPQPLRSQTCPPHEDMEHPVSPASARRRMRKPRQSEIDDIISPAESVSIVAIEQILPRPHKCSKGENCSKWRKQQRQLARIGEAVPLSSDKDGRFVLAHEPPTPASIETSFRPTSDVVPSVVASSDVLGPSQYPQFRLQEERLRVIETRDPQENVKQFLNFQHINAPPPPEEPSTPPLELFPPLHPPENTPGAHEYLRSLPKLSIPLTRSASTSPQRPYHYPTNSYSPLRTIVPSDRHGTPFSEMDVPVTAVPIGPIARDISQSVPPNMQFGNRERDNSSRASSRSENRRPSFALERIKENVLSPVDQPEEMPAHAHHSYNSSISHAGWMKKRKTKFLRHEWQENHYKLEGTKLAMHKDEQTIDALEYIDVDDYAIACSSLASNKLGAALKSLKLSGSGKKKDADISAFAFQLIPSIDKKGVRAAALGKTHHFAVKSREERIDWMRELMLAKALKQKGDGYEVNVNGNKI
ncbi:hypothetical protein L228DRAFT_267098 [Xylona heveae TC161]|uniref:SAM and PH domain-containing protein n=1 Tax=Xylona heveae (strain CBS 132557 / TC161) TaxID=1328760 RepID=A0A165IES7_XYLHT|nr:hypothetical protein L228DRAFT_267098 [Xylona heveae TC161]KZF24792.1 hypothetical protein L228DRAFT_267098 [Xylona heveae TC161]